MRQSVRTLGGINEPCDRLNCNECFTTSAVKFSKKKAEMWNEGNRIEELVLGVSLRVLEIFGATFEVAGRSIAS